MLKWSPVWPVTASSSWFCVLLTPPSSSPFLLSGRKTVSGSLCSVSASVPESAVSPGSPSAFEWKVTFRSKDQDTGCSIASDHPFSQTLLLGRGGRHACVRVRNSHVQPRVSLFLPVPIEDHGCTPTPLTPLQPHQAIPTWCLCTSVPFSPDRKKPASVIPVYLIGLSPCTWLTPGPAGLCPSHAPQRSPHEGLCPSHAPSHARAPSCLPTREEDPRPPSISLLMPFLFLE